MEPYTTETGRVAPLDRADVDTDQIIPSEYLKRIERTGFGRFLFAAWRYRPDGEPDPDFVLNRPAYDGATILVTGANFGCGSSREHAPWALLDHGFRTIIAPSFADIFRNNCYQNGMLPVELPRDTVRRIMDRAAAGDGYTLTVDLEARRVEDGEDLAASFEIDSFQRDCLLQGLDAIDLTLRHEEAIADYERTRMG